MPRKSKLQDIDEDSIWNFRGVKKNKKKREKILKPKDRFQRLLVQAPVIPKVHDTRNDSIELDSPEIVPDTPPLASSQLTSAAFPQSSVRLESDPALSEMKQEENSSSTEDVKRTPVDRQSERELALPDFSTELDKGKMSTLKLKDGAGDGFFKENEDDPKTMKEEAKDEEFPKTENFFSQNEARGATDEINCAAENWVESQDRGAEDLSEKDEEETLEEEVGEMETTQEGELKEEQKEKKVEISSTNSFDQSCSKWTKYRQSNLSSFLGLKKEKCQRQTSLLAFFADPKLRSEQFVKEPSSSGTSKPRSQSQHESDASSSKHGPRRCPFYKWIPGTNFTVDAFRYGAIPGCTAYFLTHFHFDHYGGLTRHFKQSIYCSKETANLVVEKLRVNRSQICSLDWNIPTEVEGTKVTLMDANHCPGAAMILFELPSGLRHLHTGDFRASMELCQQLAIWRGKVDNLYLDTTYCDPAYAFPPQQEAVEAVKQLLEAEGSLSQTLVLCGSYTIGKERIFMAVAETLGSSVFVRQDKLRVLRCLEDPQLNAVLTSDAASTNIHVVPMSDLRPDKLTQYRLRQKQKFDRVIAFRPTGWTHSGTGEGPIHRVGGAADSVIYGVSYSEHSSFTELRHFVRTVRPRKIIPTVNVGNASARENMNQLFCEWLEKC